jgi:hypothetical protein
MRWARKLIGWVRKLTRRVQKLMRWVWKLMRQVRKLMRWARKLMRWDRRLVRWDRRLMRQAQKLMRWVQSLMRDSQGLARWVQTLTLCAWGLVRVVWRLVGDDRSLSRCGRGAGTRRGRLRGVRDVRFRDPATVFRTGCRLGNENRSSAGDSRSSSGSLGFCGIGGRCLASGIGWFQTCYGTLQRQ